MPGDQFGEFSFRARQQRVISVLYCVLQLLLSILVSHITLLGCTDDNSGRKDGRKYHPCLVQMSVAASSFARRANGTYEVFPPFPSNSKFTEPWLACSRRLVSWRAAQKMARGNIGDWCGAGKRENFRASPQSLPCFLSWRSWCCFRTKWTPGTG